MTRVDVAFGPSTSANLPLVRDVVARLGGRMSAGRTSVSVELDHDPKPYGQLYRLLELVGSWRATTVDVDDEPEPVITVKAMAFCARTWLRDRPRCAERYHVEVWAKCHVCPLFERERAQREISEYERFRGRTEVYDADVVSTRHGPLELEERIHVDPYRPSHRSP